MKINRIELFNIGPYEEYNCFDLAEQKMTGKISVFGGKNGAGKTTLFSGIKLCLYGHKEAGYKAVNAYYKRAIKKLVNDKAKLDKNPVAYVMVDISLFNGQDWDVYDIKRIWKIENDDFEKFEVSKNGVLFSEDEIVDFENYLLNLVPPQLFDLYFFDGETIANSFLEGNNNETIKQAFLTICGYDTFDIMYKNFKRITRDSGVDDSIITKYLNAEERYNQAVIRKNTLEEELNKLNEELNNTDMELAAIEKTYKDNGGVSKEEWAAKEFEIKNEERIREEKNSWLKNAANEMIPYIILKEQLRALSHQMDVENEIENKIAIQKATKEIVPDVLAEIGSEYPVIDELIKQAIIDKLLQKMNIQDSDKRILYLSKEEEAKLSKDISLLAGYDAKSIVLAKKEVKKSIKKVQKLREEMERLDISSSDKYIKERNCFLDKKTDIINKIYRISTELNNEVENEINLSNAEYKLMEKALDKHLKDKSVEDLTAKSILFLDALQKRLYKSEIAKVEELFMKKMSVLRRKEQFISRIHIDDSFNVHLYKDVTVELKTISERILSTSVEDYINTFGKIHSEDLMRKCKVESLLELSRKYLESDDKVEVLYEFDKSIMSAGEKQVFIMALYWAMMQLCNKEVPFIIDTPFARIDTEHRSHITKYFFKELKGQVLIFSTDEEITEEHMDVIGDDLQSLFLLENVDNKRTRITAGKYFGD